VITAINIALLVVVLATVALVVVRRRRSGAGDEVVSEEESEETPSPVAGPAAADDEEASIVALRHAWTEAVATLTPVREDHEEAYSPAGTGARDARDDADDGAEDGAEDLDAAEGEQGQDTGEIQGLALEATIDPDDGLGGIITDPGWYLPGEVDMSWEDPSSEAGFLIPEDDLVISDGLLDDGLEPVTEAPAAPPPAESANDFSATPGWAAPVENGAEPAWPGWLELADEEGAAAAAVDEVSFDVTPGLSEDLFSLPPPPAGAAEGEQDVDASAFPLDGWQDPATPSLSFALEGPPADGTSTQHGPLNGSIDPAALFALDTERIECSTSRGEDDVPWEPAPKVELREDAGAPGGNRPEKAPSHGDHGHSKAESFWTRDDLIERIQAWNETYGSPPGARDWSPSMARKQGRDDIAERFERDGCWPYVNTVQRVFGSWNEGVRAAGFTPRRAGARGPGNPRAVPLLADD
jgi:Homing endonuclease associated repeat